ncbi:PD-(D/E)XK nuclease family protein [Dermabacteraceae bacterium TAE3-ERU27]|nr:PD-(D/E)XK nuclease family protein [Dermabacteraceae bacterium TAE3-ERU27]
MKFFSAPAQQSLRLVAPDTSRCVSLPERLGREQEAALQDLLGGANVLAYGRPGSGRSTLAFAAACALAQEQRLQTVLLAPTRRAADRLRDSIAAHPGLDVAARGRLLVMTPAGLSLSLLSRAAQNEGRGVPTLVTGADHDAILADILRSAPQEWGISLPSDAVHLPGFRNELRDLLMRAEEAGYGPQELARLGQSEERPQWLAAAQIQRTYLDVLALESASALDSGERLDPSRLVGRAAQLLDTQAGDALLPDALVVDDAQDLTAAGVRLLSAAAARCRLLLTSCPDVATETFRGALPDAAARVCAALAQEPKTHLLQAVYRGQRPALAMLENLRARLPLEGAPNESRREIAATDTGTQCAAVTCASEDDEAEIIASTLRDLHHSEGIAYRDMVVVHRASAGAEELGKRLHARGLAVDLPAAQRPLRDIATVTDLFRLVRIARGEESLDTARLEDLLRGPYGDIDALRIRRIRRLARERLAAENAATTGPETIGVETSGEETAAAEATGPEADPLLTLVEMALTGESERAIALLESRNRTGAPLQRLLAMLGAVARQEAQAMAGEVLWAAWSASRLEKGWQQAVLQDGAAGPRAQLAGQRLDALAQLFNSAERFSERRPQTDVGVFMRHVESLAVPEDSLTPRARVGGRLTVTTPAQLAGGQWRVVVLAGLQDGVWPNTRLRSTVLGASDLALYAATGELPRTAQQLRAVHRARVLDDELRFAVAALSRAEYRILCTALQAPDTLPSPLFTLLSQLCGGEGWWDRKRFRSDPGPAPDRVRLLRHLRRLALGPRPEQGDEQPEQAEAEESVREEAVALLAALAAHGVSGADPATWYHQEASSEQPLTPPGQPTRLSPSALDTLRECPRRWLLERSGGQGESGAAQRNGILVHALAEKHPRANGEELLAALHEAAPPPGEDATWHERRDYQALEEKVKNLGEHLADPSREVVGSEVPFTVDLPDSEKPEVRLGGVIDRIEKIGDAVLVVDIKTGNTAKSVEAAREDTQLASYQTALTHGALEGVTGTPGGAELLYLSPLRTRKQPPLETFDNPHWFTELALTAGRLARESWVEARRNPRCGQCAVKHSCPLQKEGATL